GPGGAPRRLALRTRLERPARRPPLPGARLALVPVSRLAASLARGRRDPVGAYHAPGRGGLPLLRRAPGQPHPPGTPPGAGLPGPLVARVHLRLRARPGRLPAPAAGPAGRRQRGRPRVRPRP